MSISAKNFSARLELFPAFCALWVERKEIMKIIKVSSSVSRLALAAVIGCFPSSIELMAQDSVFQTVCTNSTIEGDYGFVVTGMRPSSPGGPVETIVGVAMTHFDGNGNLTQTDNIHGSISGTPSPNRPGTGTYSINADCSGTMTLSNQGSPPLTLSIVVVNDGNEIRTAVTDPTANVTAGTSPPQVIVTSDGRRVMTRQRGNTRSQSESTPGGSATAAAACIPPDPCKAIR